MKERDTIVVRILKPDYDWVNSNFQGESIKEKLHSLIIAYQTQSSIGKPIPLSIAEPKPKTELEIGERVGIINRIEDLKCDFRIRHPEQANEYACALPKPKHKIQLSKVNGYYLVTYDLCSLCLKRRAIAREYAIRMSETKANRGTRHFKSLHDKMVECKNFGLDPQGKFCNYCWVKKKHIEPFHCIGCSYWAIKEEYDLVK